MSLSADERETIVRFSDAEELANVWTAQRPVITKLRKNPAATLLDEGNHEGSAWAEFELPKQYVSFRSKKRSGNPNPEGLAAYRKTLTGTSVIEEGEAA